MPNLLGDYLTSRFCKRHVSNRTPEVHVSFFISWYPPKWVVVSLRGIFGHSDFHYVKRSSLDMERIFFSPNFDWFSWLCGTSFDVMMIVCWMLWQFYFFWSSPLCLWFSRQLSVSFCWYNTRRRFLKRHAGLVKNRYQQLLIAAVVNFSISSKHFVLWIVSRMREALMVQEQLIYTQT